MLTCCKRIDPPPCRVGLISTAMIMLAQADSGPMKGLVSWSVVTQSLNNFIRTVNIDMKDNPDILSWYSWCCVEPFSHKMGSIFSCWYFIILHIKFSIRMVCVDVNSLCSKSAYLPWPGSDSLSEAPSNWDTAVPLHTIYLRLLLDILQHNLYRSRQGNVSSLQIWSCLPYPNQAHKTYINNGLVSIAQPQAKRS